MNRHISFKTAVFVILGSLCMALGLIGVFVPILPTTPFLLLAAFFYSRSSNRLHHWLMRHRILGEYLENYLTYKAIRKRAKIGTLAFLWLSLGLAALLSGSYHLQVVLLLVGTGVSIHILKLRTIGKNQSVDKNKAKERGSGPAQTGG